MAAASASKAVWQLPKHLLPCASVAPNPSSLSVTTYPNPADVLNDPSVQACAMFAGVTSGGRCILEVTVS